MGTFQAGLGLSNKTASLVDGVFQCSFVRDRNVPQDDRIFDLDREWNILFAHGKSKKGVFSMFYMFWFKHIYPTYE